MKFLVHKHSEIIELIKFNVFQKILLRLKSHKALIRSTGNNDSFTSTLNI